MPKSASSSCFSVADFFKMYFILTDGADFLRTGLRTTEEQLRALYEQEYAELVDGRGEVTEWIPDDLREGFRPILLSLLCRDPAHRASVEEIACNKWLIDGGAH
jgi:hypothetical protein